MQPQSTTSNLFRLGGCPRCAGPVFKNTDSYGEYLECLACGWQRSLTVAEAFREIQADPVRRRYAIEQPELWPQGVAV